MKYTQGVHNYVWMVGIRTKPEFSSSVRLPIIHPKQLLRPSIPGIEPTRLCCTMRSKSHTNGGKRAIFKIKVGSVEPMMTNHLAKQFDNVAVIPAGPEQQPILANLLELYAHDFSEFSNVEIGPDGRFGYNRLSLYWCDAERHPFLVRKDGRLAGMILVKRGSEASGDATV